MEWPGVYGEKPFPDGHFLRDEDEITSPFVHLIFRPSPDRGRGQALPDLQTQNPKNSSTIPAVLCFQIEQI